ncbi:MAG TPA: hypothetical protein VL122_09110 [Nitrospirota bacterium]|nr:hypothetical protein [Nitrospirota bacterium]
MGDCLPRLSETGPPAPPNHIKAYHGTWRIPSSHRTERQLSVVAGIADLGPDNQRRKQHDDAGQSNDFFHVLPR